MISNEKQLEIIKVAKWLADYPKEIGKILEQSGEISKDVCIEIIDFIQKQEFDYLVPIFIHTIHTFYDVDQTINDVILKKPIGIWKDSETKQFYHEFINRLKEHEN